MVNGKNRNRQKAGSPLQELACLHGIDCHYSDVTGQLHQVSTESLIGILHALGIVGLQAADVPDMLRERRHWLWQRVIEPVVLAWDSKPVEIVFRVPEREATGLVQGHLRTEQGEEYSYDWDIGEQPVAASASIEGTQYLAKRLILPDGLPWGYHRLVLEAQHKAYEILIISSPTRAFAPDSPHKAWGIFLPLYARSMS